MMVLWSKGAAPWRYVSTEHIHGWVPAPGHWWRGTDENGAVRVAISPEGRVTVYPGYAWDGCSPTWVVHDIMLGTPDGPTGLDGYPKTYHASAIHDALYQFLVGHNAPYTREDADIAFYELLYKSDFQWRFSYWVAVRIFGGLARTIHARARGWRR